MADVKISALPAATTPLAGTEVLPIVQGTSTVKVANNDLRPKQIQSNATSGVLQIVGPAAASTRVMTTPDANFTTARTDAAQSFTGDQTLSTGNLIIGTSGKGIDFSVTSSGTGTMTSELLADYEEGTWTPTLQTSGNTYDSVTYNSLVGGRYIKIGNVVHIQGYMRTNAVTLGSASGIVYIGGLPYTSASSTGSTQDGISVFAVSEGESWVTNQPSEMRGVGGAITMAVYYKATANGASSAMTAATMTGTGANANIIRFAGTYVCA